MADETKLMALSENKNPGGSVSPSVSSKPTTCALFQKQPIGILELLHATPATVEFIKGPVMMLDSREGKETEYSGVPRRPGEARPDSVKSITILLIIGSLFHMHHAMSV